MKKLLIVSSMIFLCAGVAFAGGEELESNWDRSHFVRIEDNAVRKAVKVDV